MAWYRWQAGALILELKVQPRARHNGVEGLHDDALKVRITAPPVDDKANEALCRWLADDFGAARAAVTVLRGWLKGADLAGCTETKGLSTCRFTGKRGAFTIAWVASAPRSMKVPAGASQRCGVDGACTPVKPGSKAKVTGPVRFGS